MGRARAAAATTEPAEGHGPVRCGLCRRAGRWRQEMPLVGPVCKSCADHVHAQARRAG